MFYNTDSADPFYDYNLSVFMCSNCEAAANCKKTAMMPMISPLSRYILRWNAELKLVPRYPLDGTWEDQPVWFTELMAVCSNKIQSLEKSEVEKSRASH